MDRPENVSRRLVSLLDAGDIESVLALYENDAVFADVDGAVRGHSRIGIAHQEFWSAGNTLRLNDSVVLETGDIALVHWSWTVTRPDGGTIDGVSAEVLRRQSNGDWKYVIDNSDGSALIGITPI